MRFCLTGFALLLLLSTSVRGQEPASPPPFNPFGDGGGSQPAAPPVFDPFGGSSAGNQPAAPDATGVPAEASGPVAPIDLAKEQGWVDEMIEKKVLIKTQLKGRMASMWVGEPFIDLTADEQDKLIRVAYKILTGKEDFKVPPPMTIFASAGQRQAKLGTYSVNPKGDSIKITRPQRVQQPLDAFVPQQPATPDDDDF